MEDSRTYMLEHARIAMADCHDLVLLGMRSVLSRHGVEVVDLYKSGQELLSGITQQRYDLYILDIIFLDMDTPLLVDAIRHRQPEARILLCTMVQDLPLMRKLINKNVNGIIYRNRNSDDIIKAIETIFQGKQYFSREFKKMAEASCLMQEQPSQREIDVMKAMAKGFTSKEIAEYLFISENTVEAHRKNLFFKLKARNIADLIVKAISRGYINPTEI